MASVSGNRLRLSLLVLLGWAIIGWFGGPLLARLGEATFDLAGIAIPQQLLAAVIFVIGMSAFFESRELGLVAPVSLRSLLLLWLPGLYAAGFVALAILFGPPSADVALPLLVSTTLGAISQELMLRGILFAGLRSKYSLRATVWISSIVSGLLWLPVWLWYGQWEQGIAEVILSFFLAILFAAIRVRTGSLYVCIAAHVVWSYCLVLSRMAGGGTLWDPMEFNLLAVLLPLYGLFLLRRKALARMAGEGGVPFAKAES